MPIGSVRGKKPLMRSWHLATTISDVEAVLVNPTNFFLLKIDNTSRLKQGGSA